MEEGRKKGLMNGSGVASPQFLPQGRTGLGVKSRVQLCSIQLRKY